MLIEILLSVIIVGLIGYIVYVTKKLNKANAFGSNLANQAAKTSQGLGEEIVKLENEIKNLKNTNAILDAKNKDLTEEESRLSESIEINTKAIERLKKIESKYKLQLIDLGEKEQKIKQLEEDLDTLEESTDQLLQNQDMYEDLYDNIIAELQQLHDFFFNKTISGYFEDNLEIREISEIINKAKNTLLTLIKEKFEIENIEEVETIFGKNKIIEAKYQDLKPRQVIGISGSHDPRNDKPNNPQKFDINKYLKQSSNI